MLGPQADIAPHPAAELRDVRWPFPALRTFAKDRNNGFYENADGGFVRQSVFDEVERRHTGLMCFLCHLIISQPVYRSGPFGIECERNRRSWTISGLVALFRVVSRGTPEGSRQFTDIGELPYLVSTSVERLRMIRSCVALLLVVVTRRRIAPISKNFHRYLRQVWNS